MTSDDPADTEPTDEPATDPAGGAIHVHDRDARPAPATHSPVDLDQISADLDGVVAALGRLDDGTYWTDDVTGEPIAESVLAADPVARRNPTEA